MLFGYRDTVNLVKYIWERRHRLKGKNLSQILNASLNLFENTLRHTRMCSLPMTLQIEPTNRCNLSCKQCFRYDRVSKRILGDLTFENFEKIMNQFPKVFDVSLIGLGESFMNKDLYRMIDSLDKRNVDISLTTNGTVLDKKTISSINKAKKVYIQFSLDAALRDTYKKIRGVDCFDKVLSNIKEFIKFKKKSVHASLGFVVMLDNYHELDEFVRLAAELNINTIHLGDLNGPWLGDNRDELLIDNTTKIKKNIEKAYKTAKKKGVEIKYNKYAYLWGEEANITKCWFLWQFPYITWDGYLTTCCNLPNPETHNFGNVLKSSFKELWNSVSYRDFRETLKKGRPKKICRTCHLAN